LKMAYWHDMGTGTIWAAYVECTIRHSAHGVSGENMYAYQL